MVGNSQERGVGFGQLLQQAREEALLSREQLAKRVGVDPSYIWRIEERGQRRPSAELSLALAEALGVADDSLNSWLVAAGHEPIPMVTSIRPLIRSRGKSRRSGNMPPGTVSDITVRAKRLADLGFTNTLIERLLNATALVPLPDQTFWANAITRSLEFSIRAMQCPIKVAVIPAAGGLHRILATHVTQRLILGAIEEALHAGIREIVLVLAPGSRESLYEPLLAALTMAILPHAKLHYAEQARPVGLGD